MSKTKQPKRHSELARKGKSAKTDGVLIRKIRHSLHRPALLAGTSALALVLAMPIAHARQLGGYNAAFSAPNMASNAAITSAQQAAAATQQARTSLLRATQAKP